MPTILVVEDEPSVRTLVAMVLEKSNHTVVAAANGLEGIALFRSFPDRFDLVVTDLQMPVIDGHELVGLIRQTGYSPKIICMSGYTDRPIPVNVEFLPKPFQPKQLRACVDRVLGRP